MISDHKDIILKRLNVDKELLKDVAEDYNVSIRHLSASRKKWMGADYYPMYKSSLDEHQDDIIQRWANDETIYSIAKSYQVSHSMVWTSLKRWRCFMGY